MGLEYRCFRVSAWVRVRVRVRARVRVGASLLQGAACTTRYRVYEAIVEP